MRYFEIEGKTAEEAINAFLAEKNIPKDYIETEVLEQGSKGFLGFGSKTAKVKVIFNDTEFIKRKAKITLSEILDKAGFNEYNIEMNFDNPILILNIISPDSSLLIGKSAQTLDSLQFIMDKMMMHDDLGEIEIMLDVESYRRRIVKSLTEKALKLARGVKKSGRPAKMGPMVTMIRKEIHVALKEIQGITTISKGQGNVKELIIAPERRGRRRSSNTNNSNPNSNKPAAETTEM